MGFFSRLFGGGGGDNERTEALKQVFAGKVIGIVDPSMTIRAVLRLGCQSVDADVVEIDDLRQLEVDGRLDALLLDSKTVRMEDSVTLQQVKERHPGVVIFLMVAKFEKPSQGVEQMPGFDGTYQKPFEINNLLEAIAEKLPGR